MASDDLSSLFILSPLCSLSFPAHLPHRVLLRTGYSSVGKASACNAETWVQSLSQEDSLEKEIATHSSILAWRIPWTEEPGGLQFVGSQRVRHD